jgi:ABC-type Zn uptake system ZnuABC Zn-binding protein ZnuA
MRTIVTTLFGAFLLGAACASGAPLRVCATTSNLGSLVQAVGGEDVIVTTFAKGTEDPHFVEARPSFMKALSEADLLVLTGLELEIGWLPILVEHARNATILPGAPAHLDASTAITPLAVPRGTVSRAMGDVHALGNPHYLLDPIAGLRVAAAVRDALGRLRPGAAAAFRTRYDAFRTRLGAKLLGAPLAERYDVEKIAALHALGALPAFLATQTDAPPLAGWLGTLAPHRGVLAVADHDVWPYFARRFGIEVVGFLEPRPGYPPTSKHLLSVVKLVNTRHVPLLLTTAYFDAQHAELVANGTGVAVVRMANQVGARPGADDYLSMIDYDVAQVARALAR